VRQSTPGGMAKELACTEPHTSSTVAFPPRESACAMRRLRRMWPSPMVSGNKGPRGHNAPDGRGGGRHCFVEGEELRIERLRSRRFSGPARHAPRRQEPALDSFSPIPGYQRRGSRCDERHTNVTWPSPRPPERSTLSCADVRGRRLGRLRPDGGRQGWWPPSSWPSVLRQQLRRLVRRPLPDRDPLVRTDVARLHRRGRPRGASPRAPAAPGDPGGSEAARAQGVDLRQPAQPGRPHLPPAAWCLDMRSFNRVREVDRPG
jgi:hypothetical protein